MLNFLELVIYKAMIHLRLDREFRNRAYCLMRKSIHNRPPLPALLKNKVSFEASRSPCVIPLDSIAYKPLSLFSSPPLEHRDELTLCHRVS